MSIRRIPYVGIRYVLVHGRVVSKGVKGVKRYPLTLFGSFWIFLDLSNLLSPFSLSMYDSLSVLTLTTCYKLVSRLSANIYSLTILLDRMAYDTQQPSEDSVKWAHTNTVLAQPRNTAAARNTVKKTQMTWVCEIRLFFT